MMSGVKHSAQCLALPRVVAVTVTLLIQVSEQLKRLETASLLRSRDPPLG